MVARYGLERRRRTTGVSVAAQAAATILPTRSEPVKKTRPQGSARSFVVTSAAPRTTETTSGSKYFGMSAARAAATWTVSSEGLSTTQFPAASAPTRGARARLMG